MKAHYSLVCIHKAFLPLLIGFCLINFAYAGDEDYSTGSLFDFSLDELLNMKITSASKFDESLSETPATIMVITKDDIARRGYISLADVFNDLPGFDLSAPWGDTHQMVYARGNRTGSANERTLFMIDGMEQNTLYSQTMDIGQDFPLSAIEKIEILYGPASAVYGANAFSGIINVITKKPDLESESSDKVNSRFGVGGFNTQFAEITYTANRKDIGISLSARHLTSDRYDITERDGFYSEYNASTGVGFIGNPAIFGPYADYYSEYDNRTEDDAILARLFFGDLEAGVNYIHTKRGNGGVYPLDKTLTTTNWKSIRRNSFLKYSKSVTDKLNWSFMATHQYDGSPGDCYWASAYQADYDEDGVYEQYVYMQSWEFMVTKWSLFEDVIYTPNENLTINSGIKYSTGTYQKRYDQLNGDEIPVVLGSDYSAYNLWPKPVGPGDKLDNTYRDEEWGVFVQTKSKLLDKKMNLVVGARYDNNNLYDDTFNPRLGVTYAFNNRFSIKSNYGSAFQAPAPRNIGGAWGGLAVSSDLVPEEIQTIDFSLLANTSSIGNEITFFYNTVTNSVMQGENLPEKTMIGAEYKVNWILGSMGSFITNSKIHANATFITASYENERTSATTGRKSDKVGDIAPMKFNLIFDASLWNQLSANLRFNFVSERETTISNPIEKVDPYFITNLNLQYHDFLVDGLSAYVNIYNLLDTEYDHPGWDTADAGIDTSQPSAGWYSSLLPQPPRQIMFGIKTNF